MVGFEERRSVGELVRTQKVIVCCGAGGVGKTTTAASLALAAARAGRKVLVLTIDPSRRLAETLGVSAHAPAPVAVPADRQAAAGISGTGALDAWMLDPKSVADDAVRRFAGSDEKSRPILQNRVYQQGTALVAGLHEYTAMKALHRFVTEGHYELVVLDTPPSRNALDFLDAPKRLAGFLDGAIFKLFVPKGTRMWGRAASRLVAKVMAAVFGDEFATELSSFFGAFAGLLGALNADLGQVRARLTRKDASFLLVTTPSEAAMVEARFFQDKIEQLGLPFGGFVLNRSRAGPDEAAFPSAELLPEDASPALRSALEKLREIARTESLEVSRDRGILADLALRAGPSGFALALPSFTGGSSEIATLSGIADILLAERRAGPR